MNEQKHVRHIRYWAALIAALFVLALFSATLILAKEADHTCTDHDHCHICLSLDAAGLIVKQIGSDTVTTTTCLVFVLLLLAKIQFSLFHLTGETPVSRKIRLNN